MTDEELCSRNHVTIHLVGEIYEEDEEGRPIPERDRGKWFVAIRAGDFPTALVRSIPLADTEAEAQANAVRYLGLRRRCPVCQRSPRLADSTRALRQSTSRSVVGYT